MEKKEYEAPVVTRIEINFDDRIVAAGCDYTDEELCGTNLYFS